MITTRYGVDVDLSYEHKTPCPKCRSLGKDRGGDNLHVYGLDEDKEHLGAKCFSCGYVIPSVKWLRDNKPLTLEDMEYELVGSEFNKGVHDGIKSITSFNSQGYRGITSETSKFFGVRYECSQEDGSIQATYYPITKGVIEGIPSADAIVGYKRRGHPKEFSAVGDTGKDCDMFMQWRFPSHRGMLLICAGEIDALSAYQILEDDHKRKGNNQYDKIAVVSPTTGEGGSVSQLKNHYEWLNQFSKIIVCYDNDEAGKLATDAVSTILPRGKVFTVKLRYGDVNEYLTKGCQREFLTDFWGHRPYVMDGVKSSFDGFLEVEDELLRDRLPLPQYMHKMSEMMGGGVPQGVTCNVIAATSSGKTTHVRNIVYSFIMNSGLRPTIISLEETAAKYNLELLQLHSKENFMFGRKGSEIVEYINTDRMMKLRKELMQDDQGLPRYYLIDERSGDIKQIEENIKLLHSKYGSKLFIIDVLSDLLRGSSSDMAEDHMAFQRQMNKLGVTIVNVLHTRKPPQDKEGNERKVSEYDALGTGSFVQSAAINIVLNRNKLEEDVIKRNTTQVDLAKCRGGKTGSAGEWFFDFNTSTCYDLEVYKKDNPHLFVGE